MTHPLHLATRLPQKVTVGVYLCHSDAGHKHVDRPDVAELLQMDVDA